jgi:SAM-dependent methyltransferase
MLNSSILNNLDILKKNLDKDSFNLNLIFFYQNALEKTAEWGAKYFLKMLQEKKIFIDAHTFYSLVQIKNKLKLLTCHEIQLKALLNILINLNLISKIEPETYQCQQIIKHGHLQNEKKILLNNHPSLQSNICFLHSLLESYLLILSGEENFLNILFPNGSFNTILELYKNNPQSAYYNQLTANTIDCYTPYFLSSENQNNINILEVGAGTGSTTQSILLNLKKINANKEYHYTDLSSAFLAYGRNQFQQEFDFLKFSKFDINQTAEEQCYQKNYYHIILATNVLHNAHNIKSSLIELMSLLKPNGILIFNEGIEYSNYSTFIYGLSPAWWAFEDNKWRIPDSPLINSENWQKLFFETGSKFVTSLNQLLKIPYSMNQDVLITEKILK